MSRAIFSQGVFPDLLTLLFRKSMIKGVQTFMGKKSSAIEAPFALNNYQEYTGAWSD
jgi:hypothetical protein